MPLRRRARRRSTPACGRSGRGGHGSGGGGAAAAGKARGRVRREGYRLERGCGAAERPTSLSSATSIRVEAEAEVDWNVFTRQRSSPRPPRDHEWRMMMVEPADNSSTWLSERLDAEDDPDLWRVVLDHIA